MSLQHVPEHPGIAITILDVLNVLTGSIWIRIVDETLEVSAQIGAMPRCVLHSKFNVLLTKEIFDVSRDVTLNGVTRRIMTLYIGKVSINSEFLNFPPVDVTRVRRSICRDVRIPTGPEPEILGGK